MDFLRENLADGHEDMLGFVELAVEELLVNVVNYAYAGEGASGTVGASSGKWGMLELGFRQVSMDDVPYLCVWIRDWGAPFDPFLEAPVPDTSLDLSLIHIWWTWAACPACRSPAWRMPRAGARRNPQIPKEMCIRDRRCVVRTC